jgi:hypothetical protein
MSSIGRGSVSMLSMPPKKRAAVGDDGVQQPGLAAELDVDGAHGHMGFARNHLQADLAVAFFQEQAAGRVQQGGAAGGFVGGARAAGGLAEAMFRRRAFWTILLVQHGVVSQVSGIHGGE